MGHSQCNHVKVETGTYMTQSLRHSYDHWQDQPSEKRCTRIVPRSMDTESNDVKHLPTDAFKWKQELANPEHVRCRTNVRRTHLITKTLC